MHRFACKTPASYLGSMYGPTSPPGCLRALAPPPLPACRPQVIIHPPVPPASADVMAAAAYKAVASSLPPQLVAPLDEEAKD